MKANPRSIHLICNAHIDPVWLWEWEEGAAEALSTFRSAADLCEKSRTLVFNHNESLLYEWVLEYEPELFKRIQRLVRKGRWHIMGGWFLQPDCNMPSGESLVRQILRGRLFFEKHFGVSPTVAVNFDPFGHSRGLVQVLAKSGYSGYIFMRPERPFCTLPDDAFTWVGHDGSRVTGIRIDTPYLSALGKAAEKLRTYLGSTATPRRCWLLPWGVGNHGGGPSRRDIRDLDREARLRRPLRIIHSTPEAFLRELQTGSAPLPEHRADLNPWGPGCYTAQVRIKQKHRALENELFATEKMAVAAWTQGLLEYPAGELDAAGRDLALAQFHDILPGSSIQPAEEASIRLLDHGLENVARVKARAFFALSSGQRRAAPGSIPVFVYNPHPHPVRSVVECEFMLPDQNWTDSFTAFRMRQNGRLRDSQVEQELSNLTLDWRKRVVFTADLAPSSMNRFDFEPFMLPRRPSAPPRKAGTSAIAVRSPEMEVRISRKTGLIDRYRVGQTDFLSRGAGRLLVIRDTPDPWGSATKAFRDRTGAFSLLTQRESARFAGIPAATLEPVRVVEDGPVRTVVEALFGYRDSRLCLRYKIPKNGTELEIEARLLWQEKDRVAKLALPTPFKQGRYCGQVVFGRDTLRANGDEVVAQQWVAVTSPETRRALSVITGGTYGSDFRDGECRLTLLRSPAYSALTLGTRPLVRQDRLTPRMDQGERVFRFWLNAGGLAGRMAAIDREALARNEAPMALSFFPSGLGRKVEPLAVIDGPAVQLVSARKAARGRTLVLRLFEPTGRARGITLRLPAAGMARRIRLGGFEVKTFVVNLQRRTWTETDLLEQPL